MIKGERMADPERKPQARLWERPSVGWRLAALVLAVAPQVLLSSIPPPKGRLFITSSSIWSPSSPPALMKLPVREETPAEMVADCLGYLSRSGLLALALAAALMLTGMAARRGVFGAMWALVAGSAVAAFAATADGQGRLSAYCFFYVLAAMALAVGGVRSALVRA
jgi:hypothetical protein